MVTIKAFPHADFLCQMERLGEGEPLLGTPTLSPSLSGMLLAAGGTGVLTKAAGCLMQLLKAQKAVWQASLDGELVAAELRRYQKFAKPGQPSPHIVQLRQRQAAARQASSVSRQAFIKAAMAFVREAGLEVPPRVALEAFMAGWIEANIPVDSVPAAPARQRAD
ncbi:hypothetical protein [Dyella humicola]|uniref:hypothetical protein n=1 Tax=Dyella humicola TaxID=2992126 RepID=UPI00225429DC|nr:hypothetical protein [Dyella humicola]